MIFLANFWFSGHCSVTMAVDLTSPSVSLSELCIFIRSSYSESDVRHHPIQMALPPFSLWREFTPKIDVNYCLWIHHWVILQFVHAKFAVEINTALNDYHPDGAYFFKHSNYDHSLRSMDEEMMQIHYDCHGEHPRFGLLWLGKRINWFFLFIFYFFYSWM